jgi:hypothetical protein
MMSCIGGVRPELAGERREDAVTWPRCACSLTLILTLVPMPKRRVTLDLSEDECSTYAPSVGSDHDAYDETENAPKSRRTSKTAGRRKQSAPAPSTESVNGAVIHHSPAKHVLATADSEEIATKLLAWFSGVHAARGMPWRKPFNPAWTVEQKGQRAYEARRVHNHPYSLSDTARRSGSPKSCSSRPRSRPSSPIITGGWRSELISNVG